MTLEYKGYLGKAEIDETEGMIVGRVINITKDGITFAGKCVKEVVKDFHTAVDDYLEWAVREGFEPEKPFRGEFLVRATPELHREIANASAILNMSINQFVVDAVKDRLRKAKKAKRGSSGPAHEDCAPFQRPEFSRA